MNTNHAYTIVGYDKDNDVYEELDAYTKSQTAIAEAEKLKTLLLNGKLRRKDNNEPFDWIHVYKDWNKPTEKIIWTSY